MFSRCQLNSLTWICGVSSRHGGKGRAIEMYESTWTRGANSGLPPHNKSQAMRWNRCQYFNQVRVTSAPQVRRHHTFNLSRTVSPSRQEWFHFSCKVHLIYANLAVLKSRAQDTAIAHANKRITCIVYSEEHITHLCTIWTTCFTVIRDHLMSWLHLVIQFI